MPWLNVSETTKTTSVVYLINCSSVRICRPANGGKDIISCVGCWRDKSVDFSARLKKSERDIIVIGCVYITVLRAPC